MLPASVLRFAQNRGVRTAVIALVGVAAHWGCLHAVFYLDDTWQIKDSPQVEGGLWWDDPNLLLPRLSNYLTWRGCGFSSLAFHLFNLLVHILAAWSVYWLARWLLALGTEEKPGEWEDTAWLAALIFAAHPLTSEATHYARARDHELAGWFAFLATGLTALAFRRGWRWAALIPPALAGAFFSKGPGLPHALVGILIVLAAGWRKEHWRELGARQKTAALGAVIIISGALWLVLGRTVLGLIERSDPARLGLHALTQCRVLPEYLWRMVLPIRLCSDHLVAGTWSFADGGAWVSAAGVLLLVGAVVWLWVRKRQPWALLGALALAPLLLRWLYVTEYMVEYRLYPTMPFVALLMALGFACWIKRQPRAAAWSACALILVFAGLTRRRGEDWRSSEALHGQIMAQYPLQLRAMNGLSNDDLKAGRYDNILKRYPVFLAKLKEVMLFNRDNPSKRRYDNWPLWAICEETMVAEAIAKKGLPFLARQHHDVTAWNMRQNHLDSFPNLWCLWHLTAGRLAYQTGDRQEALRHFAAAYPQFPGVPSVDRDIRQILPAF